ncbi:hypothetical protein VTN49DRAFT_2961 [Thermomyces lanuginosus]|uniref:uncharacterized protein n=1 Tax=Thermomyces lanuginosus TaxID=5541 RepID=UPI00374257E0
MQASTPKWSEDPIMQQHSWSSQVTVSLPAARDNTEHTCLTFCQQRCVISIAGGPMHLTNRHHRPSITRRYNRHLAPRIILF